MRYTAVIFLAEDKSNDMVVKAKDASKKKNSSLWVPVSLSVLASLVALTLVCVIIYYSASCITIDSPGTCEVTKNGDEKCTADTKYSDAVKKEDYDMDTMTLRGIRWIRKDLLPQYVVMYMDGKYITEKQHPWFKGRAFVRESDSALYLMDVKRNDTGMYIAEGIYEYNRKLLYTKFTAWNFTVVPRN